MKTFKNTIIAGISMMAVAFTISSCQKGFDDKSYAPKKPLPMYNGYSNSKDIAPDNLVAYWPFNGTLTDSISKATGVATGTSFATGVWGQGLQGASNGYALCDAPPALADLKGFTTGVWINTPPPSTGVIAFFSLANTKNFWGNLEMFFENGSDNVNGKVRIHISKRDSDFTFSIDSVPNLFNKWTHVAVTYADSTCVLYVDGSSVKHGNALSSNIPLKGDLVFTNVGKVVFGTTQFMTNPSQTSGATSQPWASYLTGKLDQVRVYNSALTSNQISALYNLEKAGR